MSYWTTGLAVVAGLCMAFGLLEAFFGWRRKPQRRVHFEFALFALAYSGTVLASRAAYLADSAEGYFAADTVAYSLISLAWIALLWFIADYTGFRPRIILGVLTLFMVATAIGGPIGLQVIPQDSDGLSRIELPWGEEVLVRANEAAGIGLVAEAMLLLATAFIVTAIVRQFRLESRSKAVFLAVGAGWFVATIIADLVIQGRVADFVFLSDVGFLGFVFAISAHLTQTAVEVENDLLAHQSNLIALVSERTEELRRTQAELIEQATKRAAADERDRIARDLHDVVTQTLFSVNLIAASLPRLWKSDPEHAERSTSELRRLTRGAIAEMRTLLREFRPHTIIETNLDTLIGQLVEGLAIRHDLEGDASVELTSALPPEMHVAVYRIAQEALNNVAKHANADRVSVSLRSNGHGATLCIEDDGAGFDRVSVGDGSMGLDIMQERALSVGAHLEIHTALGAGTRVQVDWSDVDDRDEGQ